MDRSRGGEMQAAYLQVPRSKSERKGARGKCGHAVPATCPFHLLLSTWYFQIENRVDAGYPIRVVCRGSTTTPRALRPADSRTGRARAPGTSSSPCRRRRDRVGLDARDDTAQLEVALGIVRSTIESAIRGRARGCGPLALRRLAETQVPAVPIEPHRVDLGSAVRTDRRDVRGAVDSSRSARSAGIGDGAVLVILLPVLRQFARRRPGARLGSVDPYANTREVNIE